MDYSIFINGIIHQLFTHNTYMPDDDILNTLNKYFNNNCFTITAFRLAANNNADNYQHELSSLIPKYAKRHCSCPVWFYRTEDHNELLLFNHNDDLDVGEYINEMNAYFTDRHRCTFHWGISRTCHTLSEFIFAKKEALICLEKSFSIKYPDIVSYNNNMTFPASDTFEFYYPEAAAALLYKAVKCNDQALIDYVLKTLSDENLIIRALGQSELLKLHNAVTDTLMQLNPAKYNFSDKLLQLNQHMVSAQDNPELYFSYLSTACQEIACKLDSYKAGRKKAPIQDIQNYILSNYNDANLNLAGTARSFNVSEGYLSSTFKETMGICFAEYLENIRIEKSCELLRGSTATIMDIAERTGYNSVYSFRRAFKRIMHISPSCYRTQSISIT